MKKKTKQVLAILAIVILLGLYIATFLFALMDSPNSGRMFQACLFATIGVPLLLWIYMWGYGVLTKKDTMATFFPNNKDKDSAEK